MDVREVSAEDVELEYVSAAGIRERGSLGRLWPVRFESVRPERRFPASGVRATGAAGTGRRPAVGMWAMSRGWSAIA
jgi:hypothetical protein